MIQEEGGVACDHGLKFRVAHNQHLHTSIGELYSTDLLGLPHGSDQQSHYSVLLSSFIWHFTSTHKVSSRN